MTYTNFSFLHCLHSLFLFFLFVSSLDMIKTHVKEIRDKIKEYMVLEEAEIKSDYSLQKSLIEKATQVCNCNEVTYVCYIFLILSSKLLMKFMLLFDYHI